MCEWASDLIFAGINACSNVCELYQERALLEAQKQLDLRVNELERDVATLRRRRAADLEQVSINV